MAHPIDLALILDRAELLDEAGGGDRSTTQATLPRGGLGPGHVVSLETHGRGVGERREQGLSLGVHATDHDRDSLGQADGRHLLGGLGAVAPVGRQGDARRGDGQRACGAGEPRQVADVGQGGDQQAVDARHRERIEESLLAAQYVERCERAAHEDASRSRATASTASG